MQCPFWHRLQVLPLPLVDRAFALTQHLFFGNLMKHGMTTHPLGGGTKPGQVQPANAHYVNAANARAVPSSCTELTPLQTILFTRPN